ncbi:MAG TPA: PAS domain-containing protein [Thermoanaerobaculia bacterium]|jgi:hypothetical protein
MTSASERFQQLSNQQVFANIISMWRVRRALQLFSAEPRLRHAYPRVLALSAGEVGPPGLTSEDIDTEAAIFAAAAAIDGRIARDAAHDAEFRYVTALERTQSRQIIPSSIDLTRGIDRIQERHPLFNSQDRPVHGETLARYAADEGLRIVDVPDLELLSLCMTAPGEPEQTWICVKAGVHPALRDFLIAHELGHYWLHMHPDTRATTRVEPEDLYLSSAHGWGHLENEADSVALVALFPTPYLAWSEVEGRLDADEILNDFLAPYPIDGETNKHLLERMRDYIRKRVGSYNLFKQAIPTRRHGAVYLGDRAISPDHLEFAKGYLGDERSWFEIDANDTIVDCSEAWPRGMRTTRRALIGKTIDSIIPPALHKRMAAQRAHEKNTLRPTFFFPHFQPAEGEPFYATVHSYPVLSRSGHHAGALLFIYDTYVAPAASTPHEPPPLSRQLPLIRSQEPQEPIEQRFARLAAEWREARGPLALSKEICMMRPYQEIIGMGPAVVPLLLRELRQRPDQWFWALRMITGANPVREEDRGYVDRMVAAWVRWGEEHGHL